MSEKTTLRNQQFINEKNTFRNQPKKNNANLQLEPWKKEYKYNKLAHLIKNSKTH